MKVLILGGAGMLGHQVWQKCLEVFGSDQVACTLRKPRAHYAHFGIFQKGHVFDQLDVQNFAQLEKVLHQFQPQFIINCIGLTLRKQELQDIARCYDVNSMLPHQLAIWGKQNGARVIHFSTDCVFDGVRGNYSELDIPTAKDHYGKSKFLGEIIDENALTIRLSIVGRELEGKTELLEWFLAQKGKR